MPVDNSRLKGFYKLDVEQRRRMVADLANSMMSTSLLWLQVENWMMLQQIA